MRIPRKLAIILAISMVVSIFPACSKTSSQSSTKQGAKEKVTLWTFGSANLRDLFEALIKEYKAQPDHPGKTDVELQFIMQGSGEQALADRLAAAKLAGKTGTDFDIIADNGSAIEPYLQKGGKDIFYKLDFSKIPNSKNILVKSAAAPGYVLPYRGTTVVLAYDSKRVPNPPKTLSDLYKWIKENPGRFAYNTPSSGGAGSAFATTVIYSFLPAEASTSSDPKWKDKWNEGFAKLKEIHPYLYKSGGKVIYPNKNQGAIDLLVNKEVDITPVWADQALTNMKQGTFPDGVKIYQLSPALSGTDVVLAAPSIGHNPEATYDFMNFVVSPEGQKVCLESIYAVPVIDFSQIKSDQIQTIKDLKIEEFKIESLGTLGDDFKKLWDTSIAVLP